MKTSKDGFTEAEIHQRATAALARALNTPHKLQKPLKAAKKKKGRAKARPKS